MIVRDSVTFVALTAIAVVLFGLTLGLFRSFEAHRADLAREYAAHGRSELAAGKPAAAVSSLQAALEYAPDDYDSQLLLAQALAGAGEREQAENYFEGLLAGRPGDGLLNLQLARLARERGDAARATSLYRAAIFGDWPGNGAVRRREVRLELVDFLIERKELAAARAELLIAAGNAPDDAAMNLLFADKLRAAGDNADALNLYDKAAGQEPKNGSALEGAGRAAYALKDYAKAHALLLRAVDAGQKDAEDLAREAGRLTELSLSRQLPARVRERHLEEAAKIAEARLASCAPAAVGAAATPDAAPELKARWTGVGTGAKRAALLHTAEGQDTVTELIFDTERELAKTCGAPAGDDALLLKLAGEAE